MFSEKADYIRNLERALKYLEWNKEAHKLSKHYGNKKIDSRILNVLIELSIVGSITDSTGESQRAVRDLAKLQLVRPLVHKTNRWWHTWITSYTELTDLGRRYVNMVFSIIHLPINTNVIPAHYKRRTQHMIDVSKVWQAIAVGFMFSLGVSFLVLISMVLSHDVPSIIKTVTLIVTAVLALVVIISSTLGIVLWPSDYEKSVAIAKAQINEKSKHISLNDFINFLDQNNRWLQVNISNLDMIIKHGHVWK